MSTISVFFYGYKSKDMYQSVIEMIEKKSSETILNIQVYDQTNINRKEKFPDTVIYKHIMWDTKISKFLYREKFVNSIQSEYVLVINGSAKFANNWDTEMINFCNSKNFIISGNHKPDFIKEDIKFFPKYIKKIVTGFEPTYWISKNFIFGNTKDVAKLLNISLLKYEGEELALSLLSLKNELKVYAVEKNIIESFDEDIYQNDYIPFSTVHGYNRLIDSVHGKSKDFDIEKNLVVDLSYIHNYKFAELSKLPYHTEDETYDLRMSLDTISGNRFLKNPNGIY